ncbi:hypothetical protein VCR19J5_770003 [Vibrio crassostreae]|nr:hypothetical protein VCR9J2_250009 [Vibrio crassostreae]CDT62758.1 hypothetical protein VCR15J5_750005 [Vibrio crassostreae]CDT63564.1 hypothetical protein VCR19J5_770003 [Vibrio crassostreae]
MSEESVLLDQVEELIYRVARWDFSFRP